MRPSLPQRGRAGKSFQDSMPLLQDIARYQVSIYMLIYTDPHGGRYPPLPPRLTAAAGDLSKKKKRNFSPPFSGPGSLALQLELEGEETNSEAASPLWVSDRRLSIQIPDVQAFSCSSLCSLQSWPLFLFHYLKLTSFPWLATIRHPVLANTNQYSRATNRLFSPAQMLPSRFHLTICNLFLSLRVFSGSGSGKPYPKHGSIPLLSSNQRCPQPSPISSLGALLKLMPTYCPFFLSRVCLPPLAAAPPAQARPPNRVRLGFLSRSVEEDDLSDFCVVTSCWLGRDSDLHRPLLWLSLVSACLPINQRPPHSPS